MVLNCFIIIVRFKQEEENFTEWTALKTADGLVYYYNTKTQETSWDIPDELREDEDDEVLMD